MAKEVPIKKPCIFSFQKVQLYRHHDGYPEGAGADIADMVKMDFVNDKINPETFATTFLPLTFCIFFPHKIAPTYGILSMASGIFVALSWKFIGINGIHPLIPALTCNLIFLLVGLYKGK